MHALLAIDGSPESLAAVRFFASLPFQTKPRCTVVTALTDEQFGLVTTEAGLQIREVENKAAHKAFETAKEILGPISSSIEHVLQRQHPSQLVLDQAKKHDVDLIVLGSVGHSALYRLAIGSTADYVANQANCSTLIVRQPPSGEPGAGSAPVAGVPSHSKILLAYDESPGAREAYNQLRWFNWCDSRAEIHMTMMLERPKLLLEEEVYDPRMMAEKRQMLEELSRRGLSGCRVTISVEEAVDIASGLYSQIQQLETNLVFTGDSARSAFSRFLLGSASRYLLHHSRCSLWIAREKQWT